MTEPWSEGTPSIVEFLRARVDEDEQTAYRILHRPDCTCQPEGRSVIFRHDQWVRRYVSEDSPEQVIRTATDAEGQMPEDWEPGRPVPEGWIQPHEVAMVPAVGDQDMSRWIGQHIARHDPDRVLAEVEAKRRVVEDYERKLDNRRAHPDDLGSAGAFLALHGTVKLLAAVYADHPDYDPAWRMS